MTEELFEEVDINDMPTGRKLTYEQAHKGMLPHRVSAVFVFSANGDLWVQPHVNSSGRLDHTVGGHVDSGETYAIAARREMLEEIGLIAELEEIATGVYSVERYCIHMFGIYTCIAPDDWKFVPNDEVPELILMKFDEVVKLMRQKPDNFTDGFRATMKKYLETKNIVIKL